MTGRGFYRDGFDFHFDWPVELVPGVNASVEMTAFIEPDESVACSDWYVASVTVAETGAEITKDQPLALTMAAHVAKAHEATINERWREWLQDKPRRRRA